MVRPQKADQTGRSTGTLKSGRTKRWDIETPFIGHSLALRESVAFRSLRIAARRALDFLEIEHLKHGGQENGNLAAPYRQIEEWGTSKRDIAFAFRMLIAFGLIRRTDKGERLGRHMGIARYRLTYYPDRNGALPTDEWRRVTIDDVKAFLDDPKPHPN